MSFFGSIKQNLSSGNRSARSVLLLQKIINRSLIPNELALIKEYGIRMDFSEDNDEHDFVVDYLAFLVKEGTHPSRLDRPNFSREAKLDLVERAVNAAKSGVLVLRGDTKESLAEYLGTLYK